MSLLLLQIGKVPSSSLTYTNRAYISPSDFRELFRDFNGNGNLSTSDEFSINGSLPLITVGSRVYPAEKEISVPIGQLALSEFQIKDAKLIVGSKIKVETYSSSPEYDLARLEFKVKSLTQRSSNEPKKVTAENIDTDLLFSHVMGNYEGFVIAMGQVLVTNFEGMEIELIVSSFNFMSTSSLRHNHQSKSFISGPIGKLIMETEVKFHEKKHKKKRLHLTGSKIANSKSSLGGIVKKLASQTKALPSIKLKQSTKAVYSPCTLIQSVDKSDSLDEVNPASMEVVKQEVVKRDVVKERLLSDEKNFKKDYLQKNKNLKMMSFRITLKSLCGIIMSSSIARNGKEQNDLPIFAVISYPNEPLNTTKKCTWSNIPSAPLKRASSSIGNRTRYYANFALVQAENYAINFALPMKRRKGCSNSGYIPQEIDLRLGLMRGTEVIAAGIITLFLNGTEEGEMLNIPVKKSRSKKEKVVKAGSFRSDPNKKYSLQRSFLRVIVDAKDLNDGGESDTSDFFISSYSRKKTFSEKMFSRFTGGISRSVKKHSVRSSTSTELSIHIDDSQQDSVLPGASSTDYSNENIDRSEKILLTDILSMNESMESNNTPDSSLTDGSTTKGGIFRYASQLSVVFTDSDSFGESISFDYTEQTSVASSSSRSSASSVTKNRHDDEALSVTFSDNQSTYYSLNQNFECSHDSMSFDSETSNESSEGYESSVYESDTDTAGEISLLSIRSDLPGLNNDEPFLQDSDTDVSYS